MRVGRHNKENFYLKEDFTAYLQSKNLSPATITHYSWHIGLFLAWIEKEEIQVTKPDILKYLEYLKTQRNLENVSRKVALIALNNYFTFLYRSEAIPANPCLLLKIRGTKKRTLHKTYSPEELERLYDNYYLLFVKNFDERCYASKLGGIPANQRKQSLLSRERNAAILSILIYQGTTTKEIDKILLQDIDLAKATIKIRGGKKSNERTLPLKAQQIGLLMRYLQNIRPQLLEYFTTDNNYLFLPLPEYSKKETGNKNLMHIFKPLTTHIKSIDKTFLNFKQVRASVITQWLKTEGLRKAQYLAGHRYISSTERYLPNQIEGLINDIDKLHPF